MYKINNYVLIVMILILGFVSCDGGFLDRYPLDKINDESFWKSNNDLKVYANQFYTQLINETLYNVDDQSDNQLPRTKNSYLWDQFTVPISGDGWAKGDWSNIRSCNYFLENYKKVEGNAATINQYVGEVLFFKAFLYYNKVTRYGDVPWLSEVLTTSSEQLYAPRDSRKAVMDSVSHILDKAIKYLPATSSQNRITKYTALALKSRICLFEGTFRKYHNLGDYENMLRQSAIAAKEIMESGLFELYSTGNPGEDLHSFFQLQDMSKVKEAIFFNSYVADKKEHNRVRACRESGSGFTKDFVESFLCIDGLPISISPLYKGDENFMDEFENRDPRMRQTIYTPDKPIFITPSGEPEYERAPIFNTYVSTGYRMYKMYSPLSADNEANKCRIDICVFRYGEVLLNYAEAKAELGECDQSVLDQSINKLRARVGMPPMSVNISFTDPNWPSWEVPVSPIINEIRRERRVELANEGFRWDDLCRWKAGKLIENEKTYLGARDPETGEYRNTYSVEIGSRVWNDKLYLRPIPTSEIEINPSLTQNPGW